MKFLFSILALFLTVKECDQKKADKDTIKEQIVNNEKTAMQQQEYTIEYSAMSRGFFKELKLDGKTISIKNDRNSQPVIKECNEELWNSIMQKMDSINLKGLSNLVAPTQKRLYDGAAHANIRITVDGKTYETQGFDHGFPPEEVKFICDKLLEMSDDKKE